MSKILRKLLKENITTDPNKIVKILEKDCSDILSIYDNTKNVLYRSSKQKFLFSKRTPRQDRRPRDTNKKLHDILDKLFYNAFGWHARKECVFTSPSILYAQDFGDYIYAIFPKNGFKCICEPRNDLNVWSVRNEYWYYGGEPNEETIQNAIKAFEKSISQYESGEFALRWALTNNHESEVMIKCDYYYALNVSILNQMKRFDYL